MQGLVSVGRNRPRDRLTVGIDNMERSIAQAGKKYKSPRQRHSGSLMLSWRAGKSESDEESAGIARRAS